MIPCERLIASRTLALEYFAANSDNSASGQHSDIQIRPVKQQGPFRRALDFGPRTWAGRQTLLHGKKVVTNLHVRLEQLDLLLWRGIGQNNGTNPRSSKSIWRGPIEVGDCDR